MFDHTKRIEKQVLHTLTEGVEKIHEIDDTDVELTSPDLKLINQQLILANSYIQMALTRLEARKKL